MDDYWTAWEDLNTSTASINGIKTNNVAANLRPYRQVGLYMALPTATRAGLPTILSEF
jgi:hypothetical protein